MNISWQKTCYVFLFLTVQFVRPPFITLRRVVGLKNEEKIMTEFLYNI